MNFRNFIYNGQQPGPAQSSPASASASTRPAVNGMKIR